MSINIFTLFQTINHSYSVLSLSLASVRCSRRRCAMFTSGSICGGRRKYSHFLPFYLFTFFPDFTFPLRIHFDPVRLFFPWLRNSLFSQISFFYFSIIRNTLHPLFKPLLKSSPSDLLSITANTNKHSFDYFYFYFYFYFLLFILKTPHELVPSAPSRLSSL